MPLKRGRSTATFDDVTNSIPCDTSHTATGRQTSNLGSASSWEGQRESSYGNTSITGRARAILGNVYHQHNYYNGSKALSHIEDERGAVALNQSLTTTFADRELLPEAVSSYDAPHAHLLRYAQYIPDTCQWIKNCKTYKSWISAEGIPILVCTGSVGCGKSITASTIVHDLQVQLQGTDQLCLHYFVDTLRNDAVLTEDILRALIKQSLVHYRNTHGSLPHDLELEIRTKCTNPRHKPTLTELSRILAKFKKILPACLFVIDGIDGLSENEVIFFFDFIRSHFIESEDASASHKIILFCRDTLGIGIRLDNLPNTNILKITLQHIQSDLHTYVDHEVHKRQNQRVLSENAEVLERVKAVLKQNSEKMFLWIRLQIANLWDPKFVICDQDIEDQLHALPQGLNDIYMQCLQRINAVNDGKSRDIAPKAFRWVATAKQPLSEAQLREAVSMDPTNLPLQAANLLNTPVTDFCANLLEIDPVDKVVKFAHHTVKDFLTSTERLPSDLQHYALNPHMDDLWCGTLCLAYAKMHYSRNALVTYSTHRMDPKLMSALVANTVQQPLPLRLGRLWSRKKTLCQPLQIPLPSRSSDRDLMVKDLYLHSYLCRYWLSHNRLLKASDSGFSNFVELCLVQDADIQPWTSTSSDRASQLLSMLEFGVMDNNPALVSVVKERCPSIKSTFWRDLSSGVCPGTDSTFLHVAVALGHEEIVHQLYDPQAPLYADGEGKSAAAIAVEFGCDNIVDFLLQNYPSLPIAWIRRPSDINPSVQENVLNVCASTGNLRAMETLNRRLSEVFHGKRRLRILTEAFFHACDNGHGAIAARLVEYGVNPNLLNSTHGSAIIIITEEWASIEQQPSLDIAFRRQDLKLWQQLVAAGARVRPYPHIEDVISVIKRDDRIKEWLDSMFSCAELDVIEKFHEEACQLFADLIYNHKATLRIRHQQATSLLRCFEIQRLLIPYCETPGGYYNYRSHPNFELYTNNSIDLHYNKWLHFVPLDVLQYSLRRKWVRDEVWLFSDQKRLSGL